MKISGCIMVVNQMLKTSDNFSQPVLDAISVSRKVSRKYHPGYWFQQHKGLCSAAQNHLHICRLCLFFFFFHFSLTVHISPPALCTSLCNPPLWDYFQQSLTSHWKCSLVITCNSAYLQKELAGWCTTEPEGNKHSKRGCNDKYLRQATRYFPIRKPENRLRSSFQFRKDIKACSACNHIYTEIHRIQSKFLFASITKAQKDLNMDPFFFFF